MAPKKGLRGSNGKIAHGILLRGIQQGLLTGSGGGKHWGNTAGSILGKLWGEMHWGGKGKGEKLEAQYVEMEAAKVTEFQESDGKI